jgi:hypothetical protein
LQLPQGGAGEIHPPYRFNKEEHQLATRLRKHLTFANTIALIALFVALGGTSYAAIRIGSKQIRNNSVRSVDIRNKTIKSVDIAPGVIGATLQSSAGQVNRDAGPTDVAASQQYTTVATMTGIQPGAYLLLAKTNQNGNTLTDGRCRLSADDDADYSNRGLRAQGTADSHSLSLVHSFGGVGTAVLACRVSEGKWSTADSKIIAVKVASASSAVVGG